MRENAMRERFFFVTIKKRYTFIIYTRTLLGMRDEDNERQSVKLFHLLKIFL